MRRRKRRGKNFFAGLALCAGLAALLFFSLPLPGTVPVLMYHYLGTPAEAAKEGNFVTRKSFERQLAFLKQFNYRVLTMEEYANIKSGRIKSQGREVFITFDDGHRSFQEQAVPVLKKYNFPAVMFLISDSVKSGGLPGYQDSLNLKEVRELAKIPGFSFQGHTKTHWHLREMTPEQLDLELRESKKDLEAMLGEPVDYLAYPFGEFNQTVMETAKKAGYRLAFSTSFKKLEGIKEGPYSLTRSKISISADNPFIFWYHISGLHSYIKSFRQKMKYGPLA
jgi:peptidoglycan/xylan/chitin deacetylase (PgdA/CDA1 family)